MIGKALKAFYAAAAAFLSGLGTVVVGNAGIGDVQTSQWIWIASATLAAFAAVYGVTNKT